LRRVAARVGLCRPLLEESAWKPEKTQMRPNRAFPSLV